jgi:competence protein ComEC
LLEQISVLYQFPHSQLIKGILIGDKQSLGDKYTEIFKRAGLIHIVVVSGFNVAIIGIACGFLGLIFSRTITYLLTLVSMISFVFLTGSDPPVVRAGIMVCLYVTSVYCYRQNSVRYTLFLASAFMVFVQPSILFWRHVE